MADQYIGVGGITRKVKNEFVGVDGIARKINTGHMGVNGIARKFFPGGVPLSAFAEGSLVKIKEKGVPVEFYVSKRNYQPDLNGNGKTLVVRKDCLDKQIFDRNSSQNNFSMSYISSYLNGTYKGLLEARIREVMGTTSFYVTPTSSFTCAVFLLSIEELGIYHNGCSSGGAELPHSDIYRTAHFGGNSVPFWTRTRSESANTHVLVVDAGGVISSSPGFQQYVRPCFTLPNDTFVDSQ